MSVVNTPCQYTETCPFCTVQDMTAAWRDRFKKRFLELKQSNGLTQEVLAERVGVTQGTIGHWLNGRRSPENLEDYEKLAKALYLHPAELLYGIDPDRVISSDGLEFAKAWEGLPAKEKVSVKTLVFAFKKQKSTTRGG